MPKNKVLWFFMGLSVGLTVLAVYALLQPKDPKPCTDIKLITGVNAIDNKGRLCFYTPDEEGGFWSVVKKSVLEEQLKEYARQATSTQ